MGLNVTSVLFAFSVPEWVIAFGKRLYVYDNGFYHFCLCFVLFVNFVLLLVGGKSMAQQNSRKFRE